MTYRMDPENAIEFGPGPGEFYLSVDGRPAKTTAARLVGPSEQYTFEREWLEPVDADYKSRRNASTGWKLFRLDAPGVYELRCCDGAQAYYYEIERGDDGSVVCTEMTKRQAIERFCELKPAEECLECGAVYYSPGHVRSCGMECDRCA
jgi:hypothetical protein